MSAVLKDIIKWQTDIGNDGDLDAVMLVKHIGYVLEECAEACSSGLDACGAASKINFVAENLKTVIQWGRGITESERLALVHAFADIAVFAIAGLMRCGADPIKALEAVQASNDSKRMPDGSFLRDAHGQIVKPAHFKLPNFEGVLK